ncbi:MAG: RNA 3'-terminal phosphate cyclase [Candidatus Korarchaeum sp.]
MEFVKIDGSYGEGGGSLLRYAIALSSVTMRPVEVFNIRVKRSNPGLRPQHLNAVRALAKITDAVVEGDEVGSSRVRFIPRRKISGSFEIDVGTAGSVSLIVQAALPVCLTSEGETVLRIRGGTDVPMAPPIDYMTDVFLPNLSLLGARAELRVLRRGHYPRGGGFIELRVKPSTLYSVQKIGRDYFNRIFGRCHAVKLPKSVVERISNSATEVLREEGFEVEIEDDWSENAHLGPGAGIVLWTDSSPRIGADELGEKGKPSEVIGRNAALKLISEVKTGMAFDNHTGDMIIPYLAIARGLSRIGLSKLTRHAESNIWLVERFLPVKFRIDGGLDRPTVLEVEGVGLDL